MDYNKARTIAFIAHKGQKRKDGEDYINHSLRVSEMCRAFEITKILGVLHDVVEDTNITLSDLKQQGASEEVLIALDLLTHKKDISYLDYILAIKQNEHAIIVKLADIHDNLHDSKGTMKAKYELARYILTH